MTFGILALGFPVSDVLQLLQPLGAHSLTFFPVSEVLQLLQPLGAHSLTFFPIYLPYLHAFLRWRLASWLWGSLFRRFCSFCSLWGLTVSLSSLYIFPIFMHSLGDVWHPGSGVPCFGGFAPFAAFGGSHSHFLPYIFPIFPIPYLHAFLRWRLASWLWGSLFRRFCSFCSLWGLTVSLSSLYLPYLTAFLRWRLASWLWGSLFCSFCSLWGLTVSLSSLYLPYLHAFLRWRLASWLWGSLFRRFCSFCSLWGLTVSLSSLYLPYLTAFLRWRLASWLWGSLFRRFCSFCSLWGLTVSLSSLYLPYLHAFLRWRLASLS